MQFIGYPGVVNGGPRAHPWEVRVSPRPARNRAQLHRTAMACKQSAGGLPAVGPGSRAPGRVRACRLRCRDGSAAAWRRAGLKASKAAGQRNGVQHKAVGIACRGPACVGPPERTPPGRGSSGGAGTAADLSKRRSMPRAGPAPGMRGRREFTRDVGCQAQRPPVAGQWCPASRTVRWNRVLVLHPRGSPSAQSRRRGARTTLCHY